MGQKVKPSGIKGGKDAMLVKIGATLCFAFAMAAIGFGVYEFEHRPGTNSLLPFILGAVALNLAVNLLMVSIVSQIKGWFSIVFSELDGFHRDIIEVRKSLREWEVKLTRHDDLLENQGKPEKVITEGADRSDVIEKAVTRFLARDEKKKIKNREQGKS
jgi:hypothetical protein